MAEFCMIGSGDPGFRALDEFTRGYIECMFFTDHAPGINTAAWQAMEGHDEGSFPADVGFSDIAPDALETIKSECARFQEAAAALLDQAVSGGYSPEQAGRDFWYTRNGHGCGFWSRGLGGIGDALTDLCGWLTDFPEVNPYLGDDGKVHLS